MYHRPAKYPLHCPTSNCRYKGWDTAQRNPEEVPVTIQRRNRIQVPGCRIIGTIHQTTECASGIIHPSAWYRLVLPPAFSELKNRVLPSGGEKRFHGIKRQTGNSDWDFRDRRSGSFEKSQPFTATRGRRKRY